MENKRKIEKDEDRATLVGAGSSAAKAEIQNIGSKTYRTTAVHSSSLALLALTRIARTPALLHSAMSPKPGARVREERCGSENQE